MSKAADLANLIGNINAGGGGVNRNLIINGMMQISQRGDSTGKTSGGYYACDRFQSDIYGVGTWSIAQSTSVPTGKGFKNSVKLDCTTANSSLGSDAYFIYQQRIEGHNLQRLGFGTSDAKPIVLSFYVKSNKTGTYHVGLFNVDNSRMNGRTYTIDSANTWEFKSISFDADTSAGFTDDNTHGLMLEFWLAGGTDYTSGSTPTAWVASNNTIRAGGLAVNLADSTDNEWLLTGVQLEIGQNPTEFEHEPLETTLRKCQRYLLRYPNDGGTNGGYTRYGTGQIVASNEAEISIYPPVHMRADPSLTIGGSASDYYIWNANDADACSALSVEGGSTHEYIVINCAGANMTAGRGCMLNAYSNSTNFLEFDAEM